MLIFPWIQVQVLGLPLRLFLRIFNIPVSRSFYLDSCHMPWWRCSLLPIVYNTWPICLELLICLKGYMDSVTIVFASILNALDVWIKSVSATVDNNIIGWTAYDNVIDILSCRVTDLAFRLCSILFGSLLFLFLPGWMLCAMSSISTKVFAKALFV